MKLAEAADAAPLQTSVAVASAPGDQSQKWRLRFRSGTIAASVMLLGRLRSVAPLGQSPLPEKSRSGVVGVPGAPGVPDRRPSKLVIGLPSWEKVARAQASMS